ncbi:MAG: hypothetical protein CML68_09330 [Rhodobacteraceae bacterium]|nr:hypothetical protein [Paracoccaceae bacterium]
MVLTGFLVTFAGVIAGIAFAVWRSGQVSLRNPQPGSSIDGTWRTDFDIGSENASGPLRARIARKGLFALSRSEAVYYTRVVDDTGAPLDSTSTYKVTGTRMPCDWWSITLYNQDDHLAANHDNAASINLDRLIGSPEHWTAIVGPTRPAEPTNWISTAGTTSFDLTLRLYQPDLDALTSGKVTGFPTVERLPVQTGA